MKYAPDDDALQVYAAIHEDHLLVQWLSWCIWREFNALSQHGLHTAVHLRDSIADGPLPGRLKELWLMQGKPQCPGTPNAVGGVTDWEDPQ